MIKTKMNAEYDRLVSISSEESKKWMALRAKRKTLILENTHLVKQGKKRVVKDGKITYTHKREVLRWNKGSEKQIKEHAMILKEEKKIQAKIKRLATKEDEVFELLADDVLEKFIYNKSEVSSVDLVVERTMNAAQKKQWTTGSKEWRKLTDDGFYENELIGTVDDMKSVPVTAKRSITVVKDKLNGSGRAWARYDEDEPGKYNIFQGKGKKGRSASATVVHELSHTLEFANPELMAEAVKFRNIVTKDGKLRKLRDIKGQSSDYRAAEVAYDTKNLEPYAAKVMNYVEDWDGGIEIQKNIMSSDFRSAVSSRVWSDRDCWNIGTEVVTEGMKKMYTDPVVFARANPDWFDFIYERLVKRKHTNESSRWAVKLNSDIKFARNPIEGSGIDKRKLKFKGEAWREQIEAVREIRLVKDY